MDLRAIFEDRCDHPQMNGSRVVGKILDSESCVGMLLLLLDRLVASSSVL